MFWTGEPKEVAGTPGRALDREPQTRAVCAARREPGSDTLLNDNGFALQSYWTKIGRPCAIGTAGPSWSSIMSYLVGQ
jgi:hypothetical protein